MNSIFNSEKRSGKIAASRLRIKNSDKRCKTLEEYVNWPFGQKDPSLLRAYYKQKTKNAMTDLPEAPF